MVPAVETTYSMQSGTYSFIHALTDEFLERVNMFGKV